ncbi:DUF2071 domain-containing protein [Streptomyces sp. NPDC051997]|uniref:DUF2071 domain-containing protein n=1 Tax=Streptomyces sp. NPDC051997 TaxID=3155611 RepID=UPI003434E749
MITDARARTTPTASPDHTTRGAGRLLHASRATAGALSSQLARSGVLHWPADPFQAAGLLPRGTVPDLHRGRTYVGLVFARLRDLAFGGTLALPYCGSFGGGRLPLQPGCARAPRSGAPAQTVRRRRARGGRLLRPRADAVGGAPA